MVENWCGEFGNSNVLFRFLPSPDGCCCGGWIIVIGSLTMNDELRRLFFDSRFGLRLFRTRFTLVAFF